MTVRRGEVYWIANKLNAESEEKKRRPALIISTPEEGDSYEDVNLLYLTTNPRDERESNVEIGRTHNGRCEGSVVLCNKVYFTEGKNIEPENFICRLSVEDMERVDLALAKRMGLDYLQNSMQGGCEPEMAESYYQQDIKQLQLEVEEMAIEAKQNITEMAFKARFYEQKYNELLDKVMNKL